MFQEIERSDDGIERLSFIQLKPGNHYIISARHLAASNEMNDPVDERIHLSGDREGVWLALSTRQGESVDTFAKGKREVVWTSRLNEFAD